MSQQGMVIRGGSIATSQGIRQADIWISQGKIIRIAKDTLYKTWESQTASFSEVDATGMYLLPGLITLSDQSLYKIREMQPYIEAIRSLIRMGCTSLVDVFYPDRWMSTSQMNYQQTQHYNSLIDYSWHVGIKASELRDTEACKWSRRGYSGIHITIRSPEEISSLNWETISSLHTSYKTIFHLHIPQEASVKKDRRDQILQQWISMTRYWKIRTVLPEPTLLFDTKQYDPFYHVFWLNKDWTDQALRHMYRHWYEMWPVAAPLHDVRFDYRRRWCTPEELLCLFIRLTSTNVAKVLGLYPRKGCLTLGADADIVFLKKENWLTKQDLSTILNFSEIFFPTSVMSNGKWIYRNGEFFSTIGMGRCIRDVKPYTYVI
ncbi:amidohydrolase family protein [Brevibacillus reuszeri]|uniref:amidohydrolase family protein n=1 Tax=Brevibacillus reuszeri TaxID=54915 RepID=UPI000CCC3F6E|nr:amidohydrolase family protein [Brevibacillus reuszeri]